MKDAGNQGLELIERNVVRLVVLDARDDVLLLHVRDLSNQQFGTCWELPGGGLDEGETYIDAAIRERREETGLHIARERVREPTWRRDVTYTYRAVRRVQHELIVCVRLAETAPAIDPTQRVAHENEDLFDYRWWTVADIANSNQRFYPRHLATLLPRFLAGEVIDEPLEVWA